MPITQNRMIALIECARGFYDSYKELDKAIKEAFLEDSQNPALGSLLRFATARAPADEYLMQLSAEETHYKIYGLHNESQKLRAENRRRNAGIRESPAKEVRKATLDHRKYQPLAPKIKDTPATLTITPEEIVKLMKEKEREILLNDPLFPQKQSLPTIETPDGRRLRPDGSVEGEREPGVPQGEDPFA